MIGWYKSGNGQSKSSRQAREAPGVGIGSEKSRATREVGALAKVLPQDRKLTKLYQQMVAADV